MFSYRKLKRQIYPFTNASVHLALTLSNIQSTRALGHIEADIAYKAVAALFGIHETTIARMH